MIREGSAQQRPRTSVQAETLPHSNPVKKLRGSIAPADQSPKSVMSVRVIEIWVEKSLPQSQLEPVQRQKSSSVSG